MSQKEAQFTARMDEATYDWLLRKAGELDVSRSALVRAALLLAVPQIERIPKLLDVRLEDIIKPEIK